MMTFVSRAVSLGSLLLLAAPAFAAPDIQPHRALYTLTLGSAKSSSGVLGATGAMTYEWGETCSGWTVEQRFRLKLEYSDQEGTQINSNLVTWESKEGDRYRFNERKLRNGEIDEEIRGEAHLAMPINYVLGFDAGSAKLNPLAKAAIEKAAVASRQAPGYSITVVGRGAAAARSEEERLARQRTDMVRAELIRSGVPATAIKIAPGAPPSQAIQPIQDSNAPAQHRVEIVLDPSERGGEAEFTKPEPTTIPLKPDTLFPTAHTLFLINSAQNGENFVVRRVFDGTSVEDATMVSAAIGKLREPGHNGLSPLLDRQSWPMRLAFFPADNKSEEPDYEMNMRLLSTGISESMSLDYGDYTVKALLDRIEPMPKPSC